MLVFVAAVPVEVGAAHRDTSCLREMCVGRAARLPRTGYAQGDIKLLARSQPPQATLSCGNKGRRLPFGKRVDKTLMFRFFLRRFRFAVGAALLFESPSGRYGC